MIDQKKGPVSWFISKMDGFSNIWRKASVSKRNQEPDVGLPKKDQMLTQKHWGAVAAGTVPFSTPSLVFDFGLKGHSLPFKQYSTDGKNDGWSKMPPLCDV